MFMLSYVILKYYDFYNSYGVVLWEILTRKTPHEGKSDYVMKTEIPEKELKLEIEDSCPEIIKKILISKIICTFMITFSASSMKEETAVFVLLDLPAV